MTQIASSAILCETRATDHSSMMPTCRMLHQSDEVTVCQLHVKLKSGSVTRPSMSSNMSCPNNAHSAVADAPGYQKYDKQDVPSSAARSLPDKFKGTKNDQDDMVLLGKKQVLRRNFKFTSILGFASTGRSCQEVRTASTPWIDA
jgi:hypothetical protein